MTREEKNAYQREWARKNKDKIREYHRNYYATHKEALIQASKKFRENNPNWSKEYYEKNKKEIYERQSVYRKQHSRAISLSVMKSKRNRVAKLREQGVKNAWGVVNYHQEPRYKKDMAKEDYLINE